MLTKRIIPCLDIKNGRTVKGINFENLRDAGDAVELGQFYSEQGADELTFLDITATKEARKTFAELVEKIAQKINIPFTVGGGISTVDDVKRLLEAGADKVSINSAAVRNPQLITDIAKQFGSQCVVVAIDAKEIDQNWVVHLVGGKVPTNRELFEWAIEAQERGAGEILFTSMSHDGTQKGYALQAFSECSLLGQGFGGWQAGFPHYAESIGIRTGFPPHNTLICLWSQGGLVAAILGAAFMAYIAMFWFLLVVRSGPSSFGVAIAGGGTFAFAFILGMGTNFGLVGEIHMSPVLASLLAMGYVVSFNRDEADART